MPPAIESLNSIISQADELRQLLEDEAGDEWEEDLHEIDMNLSAVLSEVRKYGNG